MSQELLEIGGAIAALVVLSAFFYRFLQPLLEHLVNGRPHQAGAAGTDGSARSRLEQNPLRPQRAT